MLDTRVYRAAFVPVVLAIVVAAFALGERARPIGTTFAPDAFDGRRAFTTLNSLNREYPRTRPGSAGDEALATRVENELKAALVPQNEVTGGSVRKRSVTAETIDGEQALTTVIGERPGLDSRRIVLVAHRDRATEDDAGRMSGTAALLELARLYQGRPARRTLTFVSTSGGTGGFAGLRDVVDHLGGPVDAVIVLGDMATRHEAYPFVIPWSEHGGLAPLRLRRTVEQALRNETDLDPGTPRALNQLWRLAMPLTLTGQGALGGAGLPAVTVQSSGETGAPPDADVSRMQLQAFGRGVLRAISALDNGPDIPAGPRQYLLWSGRVIPTWTISLIAALALLPALVGGIDGLARVRRRRQPVLVWLKWLLACATPFLLAGLVARFLGLVGVIPALEGAVAPLDLPPETAPVLIVAFTLLLGLAGAVPLARWLGARAMPRTDEVPGAAAAVTLTITLLVFAVWLFNPFTALLLVPAVHLWLLAVVPEWRLPRPVLLFQILLGLVPLVLAVLYYASAFDLSAGELAWQGVLLLGGGTVGPLGLVAFSGILGTGLGAILVAVRKRRERPDDPADGSPSIRGPLSYAGPGSLGGTSSALRR
jgi:hypothetical protein